MKNNISESGKGGQYLCLPRSLFLCQI